MVLIIQIRIYSISFRVLFSYNPESALMNQQNPNSDNSIFLFCQTKLPGLRSCIGRKVFFMFKF